MRHLQAAAALALVGALVTACGDDSGSGTGGGGSGPGTGSGPGSGTGLASVDPGSPNDPERGCLEGFTDCGDVCADLTNDFRNCGECHVSCQVFDGDDPTTQCTDGACVPVTCEPSDCYCQSAICDGECTYELSSDADQCGGCDNQCAADVLCVSGVCTKAEGQGSSCDDPMVWNLEEAETAGFRWSEGLTSQHVFVCGPLDALPTRWFRVTVPDDELQIEVEGDPTDDYVVEVFTAASCDEATSLVCADGEPGKEISLDEITITPGTTFWIGVGLKGEWSGVAGNIRIDS